MPGFDGTGPMGMGPMTGGGRGWCSPYGPAYGMGFVRPPMYGGLPYAPSYGYGAQMPYGYGPAAPWGPWAPGMAMAPFAQPYAGGTWWPQFGSGSWGRGMGMAWGRGGGFGRGGAWGRGRRWARW